MRWEVKRRRVSQITPLSTEDIASAWRQALPNGPCLTENQCTGLATDINGLLRDLGEDYHDLRKAGASHRRTPSRKATRNCASKERTDAVAGIGIWWL